MLEAMSTGVLIILCHDCYNKPPTVFALFIKVLEKRLQEDGWHFQLEPIRKAVRSGWVRALVLGIIIPPLDFTVQLSIQITHNLEDQETTSAGLYLVSLKAGVDLRLKIIHFVRLIVSWVVQAVTSRQDTVSSWQNAAPITNLRIKTDEDKISVAVSPMENLVHCLTSSNV